MAEFKLSRAQQIARELWGEREEIWEMQTADVYQKLARDIVDVTVQVQSTTGLRPGGFGAIWKLIDEDSLRYTDDVIDGVLSASWMALNGAAYHMGYEAQLADANTSVYEGEGPQYPRLEQLNTVYRAVVAQPLTDKPSK